LQGAQYGSNTWFFDTDMKKKPPAKAVVTRSIALAGFIKRSQFELNQRL